MTNGHRRRRAAGLALALGCGMGLGGPVLASVRTEAPPYDTRPVAPTVRTLRTVVDGDFRRLPVLDMAGASRLEISFDVMGDERAYLAYSVVHCDHNWQPDGLPQLDYAEGFMPVRVEEARPSFNTFVGYWHYSVTFPNDDVRLLASGNYAVLFHAEDDPDDVWAVATFGISEQMAVVEGTVSANTDVDYRAAHQQLTLALAWSGSRLPYLDAASDVTLTVEQNRQPYTRRTLTAPSRLGAQRAHYEHDPRLVFEAGNTWRRFEFVDERYATLGVENVRYHAPYHHVRLHTSRPRARVPYYYDEDQQGRFLITAKRVDDPDTEADYFWAQFVLDMMPTGTPIYLSGDFTYGLQDDETEMRYDEETEAYTAEILLKQGAYNYRYVTLRPDGTPSTEAVEGNHYETRNEYDVRAYYHPAGARYERLLTTATFSSQP